MKKMLSIILGLILIFSSMSVFATILPANYQVPVTLTTAEQIDTSQTYNQPELYITSLVPDKTVAQDGEEIKFKAKIMNKGTAVDNVKWTFYNNGYPTSTGASRMTSGIINHINTNDEATVEFSMPFYYRDDAIYNSGSFITVMFVDPENAIPEVSDANNYYGVSVYVTSKSDRSIRPIDQIKPIQPQEQICNSLTVGETKDFSLKGTDLRIRLNGVEMDSRTVSLNINGIDYRSTQGTGIIPYSGIVIYPYIGAENLVKICAQYIGYHIDPIYPQPRPTEPNYCEKAFEEEYNECTKLNEERTVEECKEKYDRLYEECKRQYKLPPPIQVDPCKEKYKVCVEYYGEESEECRNILTYCRQPQTSEFDLCVQDCKRSSEQCFVPTKKRPIEPPRPIEPTEFIIGDIWVEPTNNGYNVLTKVVDLPDGSPSTPEEGTGVVWTLHFQDGTDLVIDYSSYDSSRGYYFANIDNSLIQNQLTEAAQLMIKIKAGVMNTNSGKYIERTAEIDLYNPSNRRLDESRYEGRDTFRDTMPMVVTEDDIARERTCREQFMTCVQRCEQTHQGKYPRGEPYEVPIDKIKPVEPRPYKGEPGFENGCRLNGRILPFGARIKGEYCDWDGSFKVQKQPNESAENSFECLSNFASNGQCVDVQQQMGLLKKIFSFFSKLFGGE